jgi:hypothetical protein
VTSCCASAASTIPSNAASFFVELPADLDVHPGELVDLVVRPLPSRVSRDLRGGFHLGSLLPLLPGEA